MDIFEFLSKLNWFDRLVMIVLATGFTFFFSSLVFLPLTSRLDELIKLLKEKKNEH